jgi:hypothetical protein
MKRWLIASFALATTVALAATFAVQAPRKATISQGATNIVLDGTRAWTTTPNQNGTVTITQAGSAGGTLPNSSAISINFKGSWPQCSSVPPLPISRTNICPTGTTGTWNQTESYVLQPYPLCWQLSGTWLPATPGPNDCPPAGGGFAWQTPRAGSNFPMLARPAKGVPYVNPYGLTVTRFTDHEVDVLPYLPPWLREDYNRRQSLNANGTLLLVYQPNGFWNVFDARTRAFVKRLMGPAGDCEIQWDANDPNVLYYLPTNGGTVLKRHDVAANASTVQYDFTTDARAIFPNATRYWTKSEGSPTADGRYWGLWAENDAFTAVYGFVKIDIVAKTIVRSLPNPNGTSVPDNVTISPSGRWLIVSGLAPIGTKAYALDGSGRVRQLHAGVEHADIGSLSNGDDFYASMNYQADGGPIFATDIDTGAALPLRINIYGNAWLDNVPPHPCDNCALHISAKAFLKPGWIVIGFYGTPPANVVLANVETGAVYALNLNYIDDGDYWDEAHCFPSRDLSVIFCNDNWNHSLAGDVIRIDVPSLPAAAAQRSAALRQTFLATPPPAKLPENVHRVKPTTASAGKPTLH